MPPDLLLPTSPTAHGFQCDEIAFEMAGRITFLKKN
jgi:hypothetical protein